MPLIVTYLKMILGKYRKLTNALFNLKMIFILMKYALKRDFTPNFLIYIFLFVIYRRTNLLFIIMNDPLVNIDIDVNLFNNIYPDLNGKLVANTMIARSSIN